jgi:hypothetical protein
VEEVEGASPTASFAALPVVAEAFLASGAHRAVQLALLSNGPKVDHFAVVTNG